MRAAGKLRDRVRFQRRVTTDDGHGNEEAGWGDLTPPVVRACELRPTRGGETVQSGRLTGQALWDCWVRSDSGTRDVRVGDRVVDARDERRTWNIRFIGDMDGRNAWLLIQMETGVADG
jgi:head-tail adaptor